MKEIKLSQGYVAIVDDEDYDRVLAHKWCAQVETRADGTMRVYAIRGVPSCSGGQKTRRLHRFIIDAPDGLQVDHINGDGLDNRRCNLRVCTNSENQCNARAKVFGSSKFKGVSWHKMAAKWQARIKVNRKEKYLGCFTSEIDAARAYDAAAIKNYGEFAKTNGLAVV